MKSWAAHFVLGLVQVALVAGDISLQLFTDADCGADGGRLLQNVHSNAANAGASSGCITVGDFSSINIVSADAGFSCEVFSDPQCTTSLGSFTELVCTNVIGQAAKCLNQAVLDNPFADFTGVLSIGQTAVQVVGGRTLGTQLNQAVSQACANGVTCDNTVPLVITQSFPPTNPACNEGLQLIPAAKAEYSTEDCTTTITISGTFGSINERDYMKGLLQRGLEGMPSPVTFLRVDMEQNGVPQALNLQVNVASQCVTVPPPSGFQCSDVLKDAVSASLSLVPAVGGLAALEFNVVCDANGD